MRSEHRRTAPRGIGLRSVCFAALGAFVAVACSSGGKAGGGEASFGPGGGGDMAEPTGAGAGTSGGLGASNSTADGSGNEAGGDNGSFCQDSDQDGYGQGCGLGEDCDDNDPNVNPAAMETCDNTDENCNGEVDDGCECPNDGISGNCNIPTDLGPLGVGDSVMGVVGNVPADNGVDWYTVAFPLEGARPGTGVPTIEFLINEDDQFVFDVVQAPCDAVGVPCTSGGTQMAGTALTAWTFEDQGAPECCTAPMDSLVPWPDPVYVKVYRTTMGASCATYQLRFARPG